jgi:hypothetical protein
MPTIVVSGHARKVGKTSVAAALISSFPQYSWIALKVSTHWHSQSSTEDDCVVYEEKSLNNSDSARFLAAGAKRSFWVHMRECKMESAMLQLQPILQSSSFVIIEGNNILKYINADIHLMVVNCTIDEIKESARSILERLDILILINSQSATPSWQKFMLNIPAEIAIFDAEEPQILPSELLNLIQARLTSFSL